ncbi:hypothetical protein K470DRAFT_264493 [Piedraia hortae CBS 480.64]|uniref:Uncharacterized protein n=1 Tax=Piedraia hortae CBS 480.64 TaxID=1314780 RepID=A0A6A7BYA8_9PEZI|nr:hypothetical protein K470DRAFT_264493 [Piedraia hortae CBS 480.64]
MNVSRVKQETQEKMKLRNESDERAKCAVAVICDGHGSCWATLLGRIRLGQGDAAPSRSAHFYGPHTAPAAPRSPQPPPRPIFTNFLAPSQPHQSLHPTTLLPMHTRTTRSTTAAAAAAAAAADAACSVGSPGSANGTSAADAASEAVSSIASNGDKGANAGKASMAGKSGKFDHAGKPGKTGSTSKAGKAGNASTGVNTANAGDAGYVTTTAVTTAKATNKNSASTKKKLEIKQLYLEEGSEWFLLDVAHTFPGCLLPKGKLPPLFKQFAKYERGNEKIIEIHVSKNSARIRNTPDFLLHKTVEYGRGGPKIVDPNEIHTTVAETGIKCKADDKLKGPSKEKKTSGGTQANLGKEIKTDKIKPKLPPKAFFRVTPKKPIVDGIPLKIKKMRSVEFEEPKVLKKTGMAAKCSVASQMNS